MAQKNRKIRIAQILEATIGGTRTHLGLLVNYLDKKKFDISVICSTRRDRSFVNDIEKMEKLGISVYPVDMVRSINPFLDLLALLKIYLLIRKGRYDMIHAHSSKAGVLGRLAARFAGCSVTFYSPHAFAFQGYRRPVKDLFVAIERLMARFTTTLICVSESERLLAIQYRITEPQKLRVIPNAVELPEEDRTIDEIAQMKNKLKIASEKLIFGTVGDFRPQKGYPYLLKAIAFLVKDFQRFVLLIIGDGNQRLKIKKMIKALHIEDYVILSGQVHDVRRYYPMMDLFVLTSLWEGMPYSILEAMGFGVPVIGTAVPGISDVVLPHKTGLLISSFEPKVIADAILSAIKDKDLKVWGQNSKKLIRKKYQMKDRIIRIEAVYFQSLASVFYPDRH